SRDVGFEPLVAGSISVLCASFSQTPMTPVKADEHYITPMIVPLKNWRTRACPAWTRGTFREVCSPGGSCRSYIKGFVALTTDSREQAEQKVKTEAKCAWAEIPRGLSEHEVISTRPADLSGQTSTQHDAPSPTEAHSVPQCCFVWWHLQKWGERKYLKLNPPAPLWPSTQLWPGLLELNLRLISRSSQPSETREDSKVITFECFSASPRLLRRFCLCCPRSSHTHHYRSVCKAVHSHLRPTGVWLAQTGVWLLCHIPFKQTSSLTENALSVCDLDRNSDLPNGSCRGLNTRPHRESFAFMFGQEEERNTVLQHPWLLNAYMKLIYKRERGSVFHRAANRTESLLIGHMCSRPEHGPKSSNKQQRETPQLPQVTEVFLAFLLICVSQAQLVQMGAQELECDVSVESDNRQEWVFTLYDFDNSGKVTKEDMSSLVHTIYDVVDASVNQSCHKSKTLRVKLTVTPDPCIRRREHSHAGTERDWSCHRAEATLQEEVHGADRRHSAHISYRRQASDSPVRTHYCVDENTERRNHYLDLAGIENYTSRFEAMAPPPGRQDHPSRPVHSQSRSRSHEPESHGHQRRSLMASDHSSPPDPRARVPHVIKPPKGAPKGAGVTPVGVVVGPKGTKCYSHHPPAQGGDLGGQDIYHLPQRSQSPPPTHAQHPLQHSHSRRLRAKGREQALSPSRHAQQQQASPGGPEREHPPGVPAGFVLPLPSTFQSCPLRSRVSTLERTPTSLVQNELTTKWPKSMSMAPSLCPTVLVCCAKAVPLQVFSLSSLFKYRFPKIKALLRLQPKNSVSTRDLAPRAVRVCQNLVGLKAQRQVRSARIRSVHPRRRPAKHTVTAVALFWLSLSWENVINYNACIQRPSFRTRMRKAEWHNERSGSRVCMLRFASLGTQYSPTNEKRGTRVLKYGQQI
ncbi:hypothetical protein P4O66_004918, partial [Electrophorus voltai]